VLCSSEREYSSVRRKARDRHDTCGRDETGQRQHATAWKRRGIGAGTFRVELFVSGFCDQTAFSSAQDVERRVIRTLDVPLRWGVYVRSLN